MKVFSVLGLLLQLAQLAAGEVGDANRNLAASYVTPNGVSFRADVAKDVRGSLLMALKEHGKPKHACSKTKSEAETVLIALSKCLRPKAVRTIKEWLKPLTDDKEFYGAGGSVSKLKFQFQTVEGNCDSTSDDSEDKYGKKPGKKPGEKPGENPNEPDETTPDETTPDETTPDETTPDETTPDETTPDETTPDETTPDETTPDETTPDEATPSNPDKYSDNYSGKYSDKNPDKNSGKYSDKNSNKKLMAAEDSVALVELEGVRRKLGALGANIRNEDGTPRKPIAVIGFYDDDAALLAIQDFERSYEVPAVVNFQVCKTKKDCKKSPNTIQLLEASDIFLYNPLTITRQVDCAESLPGGVPVSIVNRKGERKCFCSCPAGHEESTENGKSVCKPVTEDACECIWSNHKPGYSIEITDVDQASADGKTCRITNLESAWDVPAPFPQDNYVADSRANQEDPAFVAPPLLPEVTLLGDEGKGLTDGPHVNLASASKSADGKSVFSQAYTWRDYQSNRDAKIDSIEYTSYGKYSLSLFAKDYAGDATCEGCVAIVDKVRPKSNVVCPTNITDESSSDCAVPELTSTKLTEAQDVLDKFYEFGTNVKNDACSTASRCDDQVFKQQDFFEKEPSDKSYGDGVAFFKEETTIAAFVANTKAKTNPLVESGSAEVKNCEHPVEPGQCTRCAVLSTTLKEKWTNYQCGSDEEAEVCEGDDSCGLKQCLMLNGDTLATVTAEITAEVKAESQTILDQLTMKGFQTETEIHRAVQCSSLNDPYATLPCSFESELTKLIGTTATSNFGGIANIDEFVFWRYRVSNGAWKLWNADAGKETFTSAKTKIVLEAWTQCGFVKRFSFSLHLHPHSDVAVCQIFPSMWYQTSVSRLPISSSICTHPKSDFAELTFDYHPNIGLMHSREKLRMNISQVVCELAFEGHTAAEIVNVAKDKPEIVKRFAVEALNNLKTAEVSNFDVTCRFTYKQHGGNSVVKTCVSKFQVKDCTPPVIDEPKPPVGACEFDECAGKDLPGPYEACAGVVVRAAPESTAVDGAIIPAQTWVEEEEKACCASCKEEELTCTAIMDLPDSKDNIKRCEPAAPTSTYGNPYDSYNSNPYESDPNPYQSTSYESSALMSAGHALITAGQQHLGVTALLGASALIALVALVVVKRRRAATKLDVSMDDVYYPLLH